MSQTQPNAAIRTSAKPLAMEYTVMFDRDIASPSEWHEELYTLRNAQEGDVVNIIINSNGGSVATEAAFKAIKDKSLAHFHAILEGNTHSAASSIALLCDTVEVGSFSSMMLHTTQGGYGGSSQGIIEQAKYMEREARKIMAVVGKDFLTDEELEDILKGAELWLDAEQLNERLGKRDEIRNARLDEEEIAAFNEKYDANSYAEELLQNLTEELEGLDFNLTDVFMSMTTLLQGKVTPEQEVFEEVELIEEEVFVGKGGIEITEGFLMGLSKPELKVIATELDITFGNATNMKTLRELILAVVK